MECDDLIRIKLQTPANFRAMTAMLTLPVKKKHKSANLIYVFNCVLTNVKCNLGVLLASKMIVLRVGRMHVTSVDICALCATHRRSLWTRCATKLHQKILKSSQHTLTHTHIFHFIFAFSP